MKIYYNQYNKENARKNRRVRNMTKEERLIWFTFLRSLDCAFTRQFRVGNYILDFYCPTKRLAVEIDGGQHNEDINIEYDNLRTEYLNGIGIKVLRYDNNQVNKSLKRVCEDILAEIDKRG